MAGAGYKSFTPSSLASEDVNTYLMQQSVMVFASSAARSSALPVPTEGMVSYLKDTDVTEFYTGSAWASLATTVTSNAISGFRNFLINGDFRVDQRNSGATKTFTAGGALSYSVDRWYGFCTGANVTGTQLLGTDDQQYYFIGAAGNTSVGFGQRIEALSSSCLVGKTATLSVSLGSSNGSYSVTWSAYRANTTNAFGTLASPTRTLIATGTFTGTGSGITRFTASFAVPFAATTGIEIVFTHGALTSGSLVFGKAQLEEGAVATLFEQRPIGLELALCQRYYALIASGNGVFVGNAAMQSTTAFESVIPLPVQMRATPTLVATTGTDYYGIYVLNVERRGPSLANASNSPLNLRLYGTLTTSTTVGSAAGFYTTNASASIAASAEFT